MLRAFANTAPAPITNTSSNIIDVNKDGYADLSQAVIDSINAKADTSTVNTALATKADVSALAGKADTSAVNTALSGKLNTPTGTPDGTKFLRDDNSWQTIPDAGGGGGNANMARKYAAFYGRI
jgi:hypothetical protein